MRRVVWGSGCAVAALLLSACWPVPGQNADRTSYNPFEEAIIEETVGDLEQLWRYQLPPQLRVGDLGSIVVSPGGVHATAGCGLVTLDAHTGAEKWGQTIPSQPEYCDDVGGLATTYTGAPHVLSRGGTSQVVAGYGGVFDLSGPGYQPSTQWSSTSFDAATGERLDSLGSSVVAMRGANHARSSLTYSYEQVPPYPGTIVVWTQRVHIGEPGSHGRSFVLARSASATSLGTAKLTLGEDLLFHAGSGVLATEPGTPETGRGVRAFSRDESRHGCGSEADPMECPVWATATDGEPTTPVIGEDGDVLYARTDQTLYALDSATGEVLWIAEDVGSGEAPAVAEGLLYLPTSDGQVLVFDAGGCGEATCELLWEADTGSDGEGTTPTIAGDVLYVASGVSVFAFSADGCGEATCGSDTSLWSAPGDGQPVISLGQLYTFLDDSVVAYGLP